MFARKTCVALSWDAEGRVRGVKASRARGCGLAIVSHVACDAAGTFGANLREAIHKLDKSEETYAVAGGPLAGDAILEVGLPKLSAKELAGALEFELPGRLPLPPEDLVWSFRAAGGDAGISGTRAVRVWAAPKESLRLLADEIAQSGAKLDLLESPFLSPAAGRAPMPARMPSLDPAHELAPRGDGLRGMAPASSAGGEAFATWLAGGFGGEAASLDASYAPCLALAELALGAKSESCPMPLPKAALPKRFRAPKASCAVLAALCLLFALGLWGRDALDRQARFDAVRAELSAAKERTAKLKAKLKAGRETDLALEKLRDGGLGSQEILEFLLFLVAALPDKAWLAEFSCAADKLSVKARSESEWDAEAVRWESAGFALSSLRKKRNADGSSETSLSVLPKGQAAFQQAAAGGYPK